MVISHVITMVTGWLVSDKCQARVPLKLTAEELTTLINTQIRSKLFKQGLSTGEISHLSKLLLKAFLAVLPSKDVEYFSFLSNVHVLGLSGHPVWKSRVIPGLAVLVHDRQLLTQVQGDLVKRDSKGGIRTVLFNVSLNGDLSEGTCI